jgi:chromate transporter
LLFCQARANRPSSRSCAAGSGGAWVGGRAFILPNFLIVAALGAAYVHFGCLAWATAIFYGVSPAVIALIGYCCYRLAKLGMGD